MVKPKNDKENNNNDKATLSAIKMKWNNKRKNIARASTWSTNLIMKKDCKANNEDKIKMDCDDRLQWQIGLQKQKSTQVHMEKSRSKTNKRWQG